MTRISRRRVALLAGGLVVAFGSLSTRAPAALDMNVGAAKVVQSQPVSACNNAAKSALNSVLQNAVEPRRGYRRMGSIRCARFGERLDGRCRD